MTFIIKNQLDGNTVQLHAEHLRLAKLDWEIPQDTKISALRKPAYVVPPDTESDSDSNSEGEATLPKISKTYRREKDNGSSDEEHIPLAELSRRIKQQQILKNQQKLKENLDSNNSDMEYSDNSFENTFESSTESVDDMPIDCVSVKTINKNNNKHTTREQKKIECLLKSIVGIL